jgi:hypothetical protein
VCATDATGTRARLQRPTVGSPVQWRCPLAVLQVHIAARGERRLRCADVVSRCGCVQRRRRCLQAASHWRSGLSLAVGSGLWHLSVLC